MNSTFDFLISLSASSIHNFYQFNGLTSSPICGHVLRLSLYNFYVDSSFFVVFTSRELQSFRPKVSSLESSSVSSVVSGFKYERYLGIFFVILFHYTLFPLCSEMHRSLNFQSE